MICAAGHEAGDLTMIVKSKVYCLAHGEIKTGVRDRRGWKKPDIYEEKKNECRIISTS